MKEKIKEVIANILYLDSTNEIGNQSSIFTELGLSSIDYIDLCYELNQLVSADITLDNLWPFNKMSLDDKFYSDSQWTKKGWQEVCLIMGFDPNQEKL